MRDVLQRSLRHWIRLVGGASAGARVLDRPGVTAAVVPLAPERSVVNSVVYDDAGLLAGAYDELEAAYAAFGGAWAVWVDPADARAVALLERRGHLLDGEPETMSLDLSGGIERPGAGVLEDWTSHGDPSLVGPLNDLAYEHGTDSFARSLSHLPRDGLRVYLAHVDGRAVACLITLDHEGNTSIEMVAVEPEARGRGIAGALLGHALADAAERGMPTSTLIATKLGRPVYERLGYTSFGSVQMWERRPAPRRPT